MAEKPDTTPLIYRASLKVHSVMRLENVTWKTTHRAGASTNEYSCGCILTTYFPQHDAPHRAKGFEFIACMRHDGGTTK